MENVSYKALISRRSIRKYKDIPIPEDVLEKIINAGLYAPTGMNRQSVIIISVKDKNFRDRLSKINGNIMGRNDIDPFYGAPNVLIVLADKSVPTYQYDGSLVMGNLMNAAYTLGVGSCWIHRAKEEFETDEMKDFLHDLGIEGDYEGIGHCILGYPDCEYPLPAERKNNRVFTI